MKAIMEGVGPLAFATAMTLAESSPLPGSPWLVGAFCMSVSLVLCLRLEYAVHTSIHDDNDTEPLAHEHRRAGGEAGDASTESD